jgi:hypothetical protein
VVVARFDTDTLDEVIDVLDLFYRDRRPGSGLPVMSRTGRQLTVRWFAGTGHDNYLHVLADVDGRYVLGPQIWPWILSGEEIPGHDPTCLRGGTRRSWNGCPRPGSPPPTPTLTFVDLHLVMCRAPYAVICVLCWACDVCRGIEPLRLPFGAPGSEPDDPPAPGFVHASTSATCSASSLSPADRPPNSSAG